MYIVFDIKSKWQSHFDGERFLIFPENDISGKQSDALDCLSNATYVNVKEEDIDRILED